jgi:MFS family permease|tara:strand:- start:167 stop:1312 length:1146 start_codon:yes stop_codon:yes gene_type:complete
MIARGALAKDLEGSNAALGAVTLVFGLTGLVVTPFGGVAADRFSKRAVLLVSTGLLLVSSVWISIAVQFEFINFWMLVAASAVQSAGFSGLAPARMAFTAELVGPDRLANGVVLSQISLNVNRVAGPVLAGVFLSVPVLGIGGIYWVSSLITAISGLLFLTLPPGLPRPEVSRSSATRDLLDGVRYGYTRWPLPLLLATSTLALVFGFPYVVFLPSVSEDLFGAGDTGFAWLSTIGALGGLGASLFIAGRAKGPTAWKIQNLSVIGFGVGVASTGLAPTFAAALAIMFFLGAASSAFQSMNATLILANSTPEYHGRMQSLLQLGFNLFGIAALPIGICADNFGLRQTLFVMGVVVTLVGGAAISVRRANSRVDGLPPQSPR